tara:strand:- start:698 stop:1612 length:915 start_codon:yes stop_codon:yes gene_type:complete
MNESIENLSLKKRAKTFYFASLFFSKKIQDDIKILYFFCRLIDDIGDKDSKNSELALKKLKSIKKDISNYNSKNVMLSAFIELMIKYKIDPSIPIDLINGIMSDLQKVDMKSFSELIEYSYKVAGTVGIMMCKIMSVKKKELRYYGIQLGVAMQLTNISRDVKEDLENHRIYIPRDFRLKTNKNFRTLIKNKSLQKEFSNKLEEFLSISDKIYNIAWTGITKLPIKYRIPIAIASFLYQSIGTKIRKKNYNIWSERIYLTRTEKVIKTIQIMKRLLLNREIDKDIKMEKKVIKILNKFKSINYG